MRLSKRRVGQPFHSSYNRKTHTGDQIQELVRVFGVLSSYRFAKNTKFQTERLTHDISFDPTLAKRSTKLLTLRGLSSCTRGAHSLAICFNASDGDIVADVTALGASLFPPRWWPLLRLRPGLGRELPESVCKNRQPRFLQ
jgi:hypothetical protein